MAREVTVAAVQLPGAPEGKTNAEKRAANLKTAENWLELAGQRGADIACLGEHFPCVGLDLTAQNLLAATEGITEEVTERLGVIARRHSMYVIAPVWGTVDGTPRNASLILDRSGDCVGAYLKVHLTEGERDLGLVAGDEWPTFELDFGRIGIQVCHDNSFPESARSLMLNGAEIIFCPHVMSGWGGEFMDILLRSPAIHNGIYHVPVSFGAAPGRAWRPGMVIGRSSIIAPDGTILADAGRHPGIAMERVNLDAPRIAHDFTRSGEYAWRVDMLNDRRPDTYQAIVQSAARTEPVLGTTAPGWSDHGRPRA